MARIEKDFDAVRMMRDLRDEIDRAVARMSPEERREYIRQRAARVAPKLGLPADGSSHSSESAASSPRKSFDWDVAESKPEKSFDAVRMMRELRDRLSRQMENMTTDERIDFIHQAGERARSTRGSATPGRAA